MTYDKLTAEYFAVKYEKSPRTIMRYLEKMRLHNIPLESTRGADGGFRLANRLNLKSIFFTDSEIEDIIGSVSFQLPAQKAVPIIDKLKLIQKKQRKSEK
jgi:predicted DNA-binding transcriptional regulator YafY